MNKTPKRRPILDRPIAAKTGLVDASGSPIEKAEQKAPEIDPDIIAYVASCKHVQLFLFISALEGVLRRVSTDVQELQPGADRAAVLADMAETAARTAQSLAYAKQATTRFGVAFNEARIVGTKGQELVGADADYQRWYKWWQDYIQGMPEPEWERAQAALEDDNADTDWIKPATESWALET